MIFMNASTSAAVNTYTPVSLGGKKSNVFDVFFGSSGKHLDDEKRWRGREKKQLRLLATVGVSERPHYNVKEEKQPRQQAHIKGVEMNLVDVPFKRLHMTTAVCFK